MAGSWVTQGGNIFMAPASSDLAIAEVEGPGDFEGFVNVMNGVGAGPLPQCPLGIVTNFSTLTRDNCRPLIQAGVACLPEAYANENPTQTPSNMDFVARNLGWPTSQPVAGVYPNPTTGDEYDYSQWADWPLADYLLENVL